VVSADGISRGIRYHLLQHPLSTDIFDVRTAMAVGALDGRGGGFTTTHWSVVVRARGSGTASREALGELVRTYWYPVYAYFRRKSGVSDRAEDLTQGLFTRLLDGDALANLDPGRGRFRSFLIACCENFLLNDNARLAAQRRGGGAVQLSLDLAAAEGRYRNEPADHLTAERVFARSWALDLLGAALNDLQAEYASADKDGLFQQLRPTLTAAGDAPAYAEVATACGMSVAAVKKAAQRLRERYGDALRRRITDTLADGEDLDQEIAELFAALAAR
jgi:RNA polymerase sigma-70 factor (ECF subfamily)